MTPELEKFCELLETTEAHQVIGKYRDPSSCYPDAFCANGVFLEDVRQSDPKRFVWVGPQLYDRESKGNLSMADINHRIGTSDIPGPHGMTVANYIVSLNDEGKSFKEIAAEIRRRFA